MHRRFSIFPLSLGLFLLVSLGISPGYSGEEQAKVWVTLRDKGPAFSRFAPTARAYEDAPVYSAYLQQLRGAGFAVSVSLKWQNRVSGRADSAALAAVKALPFVTAVEEMPRKAPTAALPAPKNFLSKGTLSSADRFGAFGQVLDSVGAGTLVDTVFARGLRPGEGVRIAVIDENFYLGHSMFDSLFARGAIVDQYDFVGNAPQAVFQTTQAGSHGAWVLSQIGGNLPGVAVGPTESYVEEDYLAAALERAVDSGAQVINISLGYRYDFTSDSQIPYSSMDGRTRPASIAALGAARRGALVVVASGNEGASRPDSGNGPATATITSPADADSILTVGIQLNGNRCSYSSTGPTFDGRMKPELTSVGLGGGCVVYLANPESEVAIHTQSGTSFAAPVIAGVAALLRQLHPDSGGASPASAQKIRLALMVTSKRSDNPNNLLGNGLARAAQAHCALLYDSLVQSPCRQVIPSVAVKGLLVWRGGNLNTMPWPTPLDLRGARLWDLQGRVFPVSGRLNDDGAVELTSGRRLAPGTFILRIPRVPEAVPPVP